jgi:hypothetical protein
MSIATSPFPTQPVFELFEGKDYKNLLADEHAKWLGKFKDWKSYITLTFKDETPPDVAKSKFNYLVQVLNRDAFGKHYVRKVGHSYFSYILAMEYQQRGVVHFHGLADKPVNFDLVHRYWNAAAGFAWLKPVESQEAVVAYCSKYCVKGGELDIFESETSKTPMLGNLPPYWWK